MHHAIIQSLRAFIADYGYWAVAVALLSGKRRIPVPVRSLSCWRVFWRITNIGFNSDGSFVIATAPPRSAAIWATPSATMADATCSIGISAPSDFSPPQSNAARQMFARHGAAAIFFARFIFGLRVFAGPLAGVLRMRWRAFAIFNFLGAAVWVP